MYSKKHSSNTEKSKNSNMWSAVRRFGLEYSDLPTMLSNVSTLLRILMLNIDGRNKKRIPMIFVILTVVSLILFIYAYVLSGFWFAFYHALEIGELSASFVVFSLNVTSQVAVVKLFSMMIYREKLQVLTKKCLDLDARIPKDTRFSNNILKNLRNVKRRGIVYWMILMVDGLLYVLKPLLTPGRNLTLETFVIYGLEPMLESPNYEIATVITTIDVMFICFTVANVTCFLILIIGYIEAQMLSLSEEVIHIYDDAINKYKTKIKAMNFTEHVYDIKNSKGPESNIVNEYVRNHLIDIIDRHAMNKDNLQEIEDVMRIPNAVGFLYLIMGLIAELLGGLEKTFLQLPFTMMQLSTDCYLGQKVIDSNTKFEEAVYNCKWENFNVSNRRMVLVMLQNAQKTMTLSSGGLVILSFSCLMCIIKNTYSAYNTLNSIV